MKYYRDSEFWLSLIILVFVILFSTIAYIRWYSLTFFVGPYLFTHWLSLTGTSFISIFIPIYYILKHKRPQSTKVLLRIHVFGNLFSFLLISTHFAQHIGRLAAIFPYLDTGVVSFPILSTIVATGFLERFHITGKIVSYRKIIHRYVTVFFYVIIIIHILHGFNII
ncbi:MAG: hypothetical protein JSW14_07870 [Candidatus Bathyarchaeum sp.]|nr:MAG: hypothetical protein JSW14_07870 [Candidatus Bathyarchaeum sp.]